MNKSLLRYVDPFFGNGEINLPEFEGLPARWFFPKAFSGNTHPGASLPFGLVSACPYSGAYPTGYGLNAVNTGGPPKKMFDEYTASGVTHFQVSGTGTIGSYYNYFKVVPFTGDFTDVDERYTLHEETAHPGYYACRLGNQGVSAELTVSRKAAYHRYRFPGTEAIGVKVDVCHGGLEIEGQETIPSEGEIQRLSATEAGGYVVMDGVPLYVYVETDTPGTSSLWSETTEISDEHMAFPQHHQQQPVAGGVVFYPDPSEGRECCVKLGFSFTSREQARRNLGEIMDKNFAQVCHEAAEEWETHLNRIRVHGGTESQKEIFYSSLYHSLVKPGCIPGENPFGSGECFTEFATLWDQYKTHMPLIFTFYPERTAQIINSLLSVKEKAGMFPICTLIRREFQICKKQARCLAHFLIADAYNREAEDIDWKSALEMMEADIMRDENSDFLQEGTTSRLTHTLDMAEACWYTAQLAKDLGETETFNRMRGLSEKWRNAFDPDTGILKPAEYYEGTLWNYSFRLLHDMKSRIQLAGKDKFISLLDQFFGYDCPPVCLDPNDQDSRKKCFEQGRFEGFNNEPDMETPYAYIYAGRHDRTAEVVKAGEKYCFTRGRGGLPGNNDSGGLTSAYVWNAIGLFPVTGEPYMLIGSPTFDSAELKVGDREFRVTAENNADDNIYVQRATLNGNKLDRAYLTWEELKQGGELILQMGSDPSNWGTIF